MPPHYYSPPYIWWPLRFLIEWTIHALQFRSCSVAHRSIRKAKLGDETRSRIPRLFHMPRHPLQWHTSAESRFRFMLFSNHAQNDPCGCRVSDYDQRKDVTRKHRYWTVNLRVWLVSREGTECQEMIRRHLEQIRRKGGTAVFLHQPLHGLHAPNWRGIGRRLIVFVFLSFSLSIGWLGTFNPSGWMINSTHEWKTCCLNDRLIQKQKEQKKAKDNDSAEAWTRDLQRI